MAVSVSVAVAVAVAVAEAVVVQVSNIPQLQGITRIGRPEGGQNCTIFALHSCYQYTKKSR